jgi:hypothetical protein
VPTRVVPLLIVAIVDTDLTYPMMVWYRRLGHLGFDNIKLLAKISDGINLTKEQLK